MEDVLGGHTDSTRFESFLADWRAILARRTTEAVSAIAAVDGVHGLVLAGGIGRAQPWPLSDIDILPIYDDDRITEARGEVERRRLAILKPWIAEGWWTGIDIGKLAFTRSEVIRVVSGNPSDLTDSLADDRWYHSVDKGYQGRPAFDPEGLADALAWWFTDHRFRPEVVQFRLTRERREVEEALRRLQVALNTGDLLAATTELRAAVRWLQILLLEQWGERDASQARVGTRFEDLARARGRSAFVETLNVLCDLDDASVELRMAVAPTWVWERHDRSWRARRHVGETISRERDARDVLRVCTLYAARRGPAPPYPAWLSIPTGTGSLLRKADSFRAITNPSPKPS